jgi:hypothetical protein
MRRLNQVRVTVEPIYYPTQTLNEMVLKVEVWVNGEQHTYQQQVVERDDMNSLFDLIFDEAKERVKRAVELTRQPNVPTPTP